MRILTNLSALFFTLIVASQLDHPKASPEATVTQKVGFTTIDIAYSRPAARGRQIFGGLVPYGRIWRVGANESTKITVDTDVVVLGNVLPQGTYALYVFPKEKEWEIAFHTNTEHWGDGRDKYQPEEDAFRVVVNTEIVASFQENFMISFDSITHDQVSLIFQWARTKASLPLSVHTHDIMERQIETKIAGSPSAQTYYEAARYYVEQGIQYETALHYLNKALEIGGDTYYFHRVKSLAQAALEDYSGATKSAKKSLELAQLQGKDEFVRMNQKNIRLWAQRLRD